MRNRRPLDGPEIADAAVAAALSFFLVVSGRITTLAELFQLLASVVFAVITTRRRARVVGFAALAASFLGLVLLGLNPALRLVFAAVFGHTCGIGIRRGWGRLRTWLMIVLVGSPIVSAVSVGFLLLFDDLRELTFENVEVQWLGLMRIMTSVVDGMASAVTGAEPFLERVGLGSTAAEMSASAAEIASSVDRLAANGEQTVAWIIDHWWLVIPAIQVVVSLFYAMLLRRLAEPITRRIDGALGDAPRVVRRVDDAAEPVDEIGSPIPLHWRGVAIARADGRKVLADVDLDLEAGDVRLLAGSNGSGKSTLLLALAGLLPVEEGHRDHGPIRLGQRGGTSMIGQRPASSVLGARVTDDLAWGLRRRDADAEREVLSLVGLEGFEHRETIELSGGELQRLAIAGAILREPALLLSDESSAMLDPEGRREVFRLLTSLSDLGTTVVHATHLRDELGSGERVITVGPPAAAIPTSAAPSSPEHATSATNTNGRTSPADRGVLSDAFGSWAREARGRMASLGIPSTPIMTARGVGHVHGIDGPWEHRALRPTDLTIRRGEQIVVIGGNGSGKSTLAWILAGLLDPSEGTVMLHDKKLEGPDKRIGIGFQEARLQLLRSRVGDEVCGIGGVSSPDDALRTVGLDPDRYRDRRIDALSGGEQRRVVLAGLVARGCQILVLDEPLAGLDTSAVADLLRALDSLRDNGVATVVVTHDLEELTDRADQVVELHGASIGASR